MLFLLNHTLGVSSIYILKRTGPLILDQMLSYRALSFKTSPGFVAIVSFAISSVLCGSLAFVSLVGRSKRALDFSSTLVATHLICCTLYGGFPRTILWWGLNVWCIAAMTVTCEVLSRRIELREIAVPTRDLEMQAQDEDEDVIRPA